MINEKIQIKIDELTIQLQQLRNAPQDPTERRKVVREVVGDAEEYIAKLIVWLRNL